MFKDVVEELVQVAEEHAEAHNELVSVAREVAQVIFAGDNDSRDDNERTDDEIDEDNVSDGQEEASALRPRRSNSADEDVDESCLDCSTEISEPDTQQLDEDDGDDTQLVRHRPEVVFLTDIGETRKLDLDTIDEEPSSSTESIWTPSSRVSNSPPRRRGSEPHANEHLVPDANKVRRRVSMDDVTKFAGRFRLLPHISKAGPAACAVTVCSVRATEPVKKVIYQHPAARLKQSSPAKVTTTAQTVRSDSGTFQVV
jgi:hypothetical protein